MAQKLIDAVSKSLGHNTAVTLITTFGSHHTVMVANASTRRLIGTLVRGWDGFGRTVYTLQSPDYAIVSQHCSLDKVVDALTRQPGYAVGKNRNYSRPGYKNAEA